MKTSTPAILTVLSLVIVAFLPVASASGTTDEVPRYHLATGPDGPSLWEETNGVEGLQQDPIHDAQGELLHPADDQVTLTTTEDHGIPICVRLGPDGKADEVCLAVIYPPHVPSVCVRLGPDGKADEICTSDIIQ